MHGTYQTVDQRPALGFERRIAHPVQAVWQAITEPSELEHWFPCSVELDLEVGGEMAFTFREQRDGVPTTLSGRVTDLDPPRLFAFYWGDDHLRFELEPVEGGTACVFRMMVILDTRDKAARDRAALQLESAQVKGSKLFLVEKDAQDETKLFYRLVFTDATDENAVVTCDGRELPFYSLFKNVVTRTGKHCQQGFVFQSQPVISDGSLNHEIGQQILKHFGIEQTVAAPAETAKQGDGLACR